MSLILCAGRLSHPTQRLTDNNKPFRLIGRGNLTDYVEGCFGITCCCFSFFHIKEPLLPPLTYEKISSGRTCAGGTLMTHTCCRFLQSPFTLISSQSSAFQGSAGEMPTECLRT
ncbi:hypothetical protein XENORESO_006023 [Xenotaenia resolanae]|uniref:Uncharacterized protein n=1 Tax=Xenotaenia resolanae TaxID=208358 RepID=A0ABV0VV89_9TELE